MNTTTLIPQRFPLSAGLAAGGIGSFIGHTLLGATNSSAQTTDADAPPAETNNITQDFSSAGILLLLLLLGAATVFYFLKIQIRPSLTFPGSLAATHPTTICRQSGPPQPDRNYRLIASPPPTKQTFNNC